LHAGVRRRVAPLWALPAARAALPRACATSHTHTSAPLPPRSGGAPKPPPPPPRAAAPRAARRAAAARPAAAAVAAAVAARGGAWAAMVAADVGELTQLGFSAARAREALQATGYCGPEAAADWLVARCCGP
jgi:hypothetical protein